MRAHGTAGRYNGGCRCDDCRRAATIRHRELTWERRANRVEINGRLVAPLPVDQHGTASTYVNHGCRCEPCVTAHSDSHRTFRARRFAARVVVDGRLVATTAERHGVSSTYGNHGCRCEPCTEAWARDECYAVRRRRQAAS